MPDATQARLIGLQMALNSRPDKAFTPHPAGDARCDAGAPYRAYKRL
ncbi:hypothetical protein [Escherichia albertii]|nr:hypothetical protein [Escherichia albertii]WDC33682.1 hypothetical protein PS048_18745 [Escherichia albertii]